MVEDIEYVVIDCSVLLAKFMPDEKISSILDEDFELHLRGKLNFMSTNLLIYEFMNALKSGLVAGRINRDFCFSIINNFMKWDINLVGMTDYEGLFDLSLSYKLSIYDASYLFLAKKYKCRLLTLDKKLIEAYKAENLI